jgi:hypothetical protein
MADQILPPNPLLDLVRWTGPKPPWSTLVPNKPLFNVGGQPMWPEFIVLRQLEADGWQGVWVNNWKRAYWRNPGEVAPVPPAIITLTGRIAERTGRAGGAWDLCAWRGPELRFVELKQMHRDRLRATQLRWMECAIEEGVPATCFAVIEWLAP